MSGVGILVGIGLFGAALLGLTPGSARASAGARPIDVPPGFAANVLPADLGAPRALVVDPAGTLMSRSPVGFGSSRCLIAAPDGWSSRAEPGQ